jgi:hypothetical protein
VMAGLVFMLSAPSSEWKQRYLKGCSIWRAANDNSTCHDRYFGSPKPFPFPLTFCDYADPAVHLMYRLSGSVCGRLPLCARLEYAMGAKSRSKLSVFKRSPAMRLIHRSRRAKRVMRDQVAYHEIGNVTTNTASTIPTVMRFPQTLIAGSRKSRRRAATCYGENLNSAGT